MTEREEREKQSDRKQVGRMMFVCMYAKQRKWEKYCDREGGQQQREWESVYEGKKNEKTLRKKELGEEFNLAEHLTSEPFNFLLKSLLPVFGVQSD